MDATPPLVPPPGPSTAPTIERPPLVWVIVVLFAGTALMTLGNLATLALRHRDVHFHPVFTLTALGLLALRGIGVIRLFFMKPDAWVYFAVTVLLVAILTVAQIAVYHLFAFSQLRWVAEIAVRELVVTAIAVYAYLLGKRASGR